MSQRNQAVELLEVLRDEHGVSEKEIAEYVIYYYMSGDDALDALQTYAREHDISVGDDENEKSEETEGEEEIEESAPNAYLELKQKHQNELNNFPIAFAFSNKQFEEAMEKLGLTADDTDKIYSIGGGGYIRKTDSDALQDMFDRHRKEKQAAMDADTTGDGYIFDMFKYELSNHEYGYTFEIGDTLDALGLTLEEVNADQKLLHALNKARKIYTE